MALGMGGEAAACPSAVSPTRSDSYAAQEGFWDDFTSPTNGPACSALKLTDLVADAVSHTSTFAGVDASPSTKRPGLPTD